MPDRPSTVPLLGAVIAATLVTGLAVAARTPRPATRSYARPLAAGAVDLAGVVVAPHDVREIAASRLDRAGDGPLAQVAAAFTGLDLAGGYVRAWRSLDRRTSVTTFVLDFAAEVDAAAYAGNVARAGALFARPRPFSVPGLPEAGGVADTKADPSGRRAQVVVLRGAHLVVLVVWRGAGLLPAPGLVELARRQQAALDFATRH